MNKSSFPHSARSQKGQALLLGQSMIRLRVPLGRTCSANYVQVTHILFLRPIVLRFAAPNNLSSHAPHVDLIGKSAGLPYSEDPSQRPDCKPTKQTHWDAPDAQLTDNGRPICPHISSGFIKPPSQEIFFFKAGPVLRGDRRRLTAHTTDVLLPRATGYQTRCPRCVEYPSRALGPKSLLKPPYFSNISLRYAMFVPNGDSVIGPAWKTNIEYSEWCQDAW